MSPAARPVASVELSLLFFPFFAAALANASEKVDSAARTLACSSLVSSGGVAAAVAGLAAFLPKTVRLADSCNGQVRT